jgi:hypothetical protein
MAHRGENVARFNVKPAVCAMMARSFPSFPYAFTVQPRYFFSREPEDGLYWFIVFQRDGEAGAFYVDLAATYEPDWKGVFPYPLGKWESLAQAKAGAPTIDALRHWYFYRNSKAGLQPILVEIEKDINQYGLSYLEWATRKLRSDKLLQCGLNAIRKRGLISFEIWQLYRNDLAATADWRNCKNPEFQWLRDQLREFADKARLDEDRRLMIDKIASDLLWSGVGAQREPTSPPPPSPRR